MKISSNILLKILNKLFYENRTDFKGVNFKSIGEARYSLATMPADCYGYIDGVYACTFETMHIKGDLLHIEHFALGTDLIGKNLGEKCLRAFAALVETQQPSIKCISFSLHRSTSKTKDSEQMLLKLAEARKKLLVNIGAVDIEQKKPNNKCYDVTGKWYKPQWKL